jgi:hypothetical protein
VEKQHQDTHHELVMDVSMMMVSAAITISMDTKTEILTENANLRCLFASIYFSNRSKVERHFLYLSSIPPFIKRTTIMFLPPTSSLNPIVGPSTNKPYPPAILVKHSTWFLKNADLFICHDHVLYGLHQSLFNPSPLFREILLYGESNEIGTNPYHPIPFDTLTKEIFDNFLYLLYFGVEHLEYLTPAEWLNIK